MYSTCQNLRILLTVSTCTVAVHSFQSPIQVVGPLIAGEFLKQYKLILKQILRTLSDISQGLYLSLFVPEVNFTENFHTVQKICFETFKILK